MQSPSRPYYTFSACVCISVPQSHLLPFVQGQLEVTTRAGTGKAAQPDAQGRVRDVVDSLPFVMLGLDLPPAPLYKDALERNIIPQVLISWSTCTTG